MIWNDSNELKLQPNRRELCINPGRCYEHINFELRLLARSVMQTHCLTSRRL